MTPLHDRFMMLPADLRKAVQIDLCRDALRVWSGYCREPRSLDYVESVCGTRQSVDHDLPDAAFRSVLAGKDVENVAARYREPIAALQDDDLEFPDSVEFAYYAIYNLFSRHVCDRVDDDWLIVNQALSAHGEGAEYASILESSMKRNGEPLAPTGDRA
ncbi:MAG: hypothetical protein NTV51_10945 [Verrucomicrobia bacterium]|nr:hypothetical protein [Verrucomicrobiota bacterium]